MNVLLVVLGAALGAPLRYLTDRFVQSRHDSVFPWGTFTVNITGSALLGFLTALPANPHLTALAATGFCGALTTYSTFSYETLRLAESGSPPYAFYNTLTTILTGLAAAYAGLLLTHSLIP